MLTRQKVHSVLRKARLTKHTSYASGQVLGWHNHASGYDVREDADYIYVEWYCADHFMPPERRDERRKGQCEAYQTALNFWNAEIVCDGGWNKDELRVRVPKRDALERNKESSAP